MGMTEVIERRMDQIVIDEGQKPARTRWNLEIAGDILERWKSSGLSLLSFSKVHRIGYHRLLSWRKKLAVTGGERFVRIRVQPFCDTGIEVILTNGRIIRFGAGTDPRYIVTLIRQIER